MHFIDPIGYFFPQVINRRWNVCFFCPGKTRKSRDYPSPTLPSLSHSSSLLLSHSLSFSLSLAVASPAYRPAAKSGLTHPGFFFFLSHEFPALSFNNTFPFLRYRTLTYTHLGFYLSHLMNSDFCKTIKGRLYEYEKVRKKDRKRFLWPVNSFSFLYYFLLLWNEFLVMIS